MAGFGLNLKLVLYLQSQCLTESLGFLNPPLLQAAKRQAVKKRRFLIISLVKHTTILTYSCAKGHYFLSCNL